MYLRVEVFFIALVLTLPAQTVWSVTELETNSGESRPEIGSQIPDLRFKDIRALPRSLSEMGTHKAWVLVFTTTQCPLVRKSFPRLVELQQKLGGQDVQFLSVNVGASDTIREMAAQAIDYDVPFPFVKDVDLSCRKALGVQRTPEVVVLDQELRLQYRGRIDDQLRLGGSRREPSRRDLEEAIMEILAGHKVSKPETPVDGCIITPPPSVPADVPAPKFYGEVDAILFEHCSKCHQPDNSAPFSLLSFKDASANGQMIAEVVRDETMPPWYASSSHGKFRNDPSLTRAQSQALLRWVETGCLAGDIAKASPVPNPPSTEWRIGEPDLVITMLEEHSIPATGFVDYRYSVLPKLFLNETWVEAFEIKPDVVAT